MYKLIFIAFAIFACVVGSSVSAGFLSRTPAVYSAGVVTPAYAATYAAAPVHKFSAAYTAGAPLAYTYATTSHIASPYFNASPWRSSYGFRSLSAYAPTPAHYSKYFAPAGAYHTTYGDPSQAYRATFAAPTAYASYAAPAHVSYAHPGYGPSLYSQSAAPFGSYESAAFSPVANW